MAVREKAADRGRRLGRKALVQLGDELRNARIGTGTRQADVARGARMSRAKEARYESGRDESATIVDMAVLLATAGVGLKVGTYPLGDPPRDEAHAARLAAFLEYVAPPLSWRTEVPLPNQGDYRAWDARLDGSGKRTGVEMETKLGDMQALGRRIALKRRDGGVDHLLLVIADTRHNRSVLRDHATLLPDLPRLTRSYVVSEVRAGRHPGDGVVLF